MKFSLRNILGLGSELRVFLIHHLFKNKEEASSEILETNPRTILTPADLRLLIEQYLKRGYHFLSDTELAKQKTEKGKFALLTFDDGYYNNSLALPILEEYKVPGLFFISAKNVVEGKSFWWDVLGRERRKRGVTKDKIASERQMLKSKKSEEVEQYIIKEFGREAFHPKSDTDRPFTLDELKDFAENPLVFLGNHTWSHAILTNYSALEAGEEVSRCQDELTRLTGKVPISFAYPNGNYSDQVIRVIKNEKFKLGFTVKEKINYIPFRSANDYFRIGRCVPQTHGLNF